MNALRKIGLAAALVLATCFLEAFPSLGQVYNNHSIYYDNFNNNALAPGVWGGTQIAGVGPSIAEANHRLEMTIPANSVDQGSGIAAYLSGQFLIGDFDVQVDFNLVTWPPANGISAGMGCGGPSFEFDVFRGSYGPGDPGGAREVYYTFFGYGGNEYTTEVVTTDTLGKLRLKRTGNKVEVFYSKNNAWQLIDSKSDATLGANVDFAISAANESDPFLQKTVKVGFDNFLLSIDTRPAPPINILDYYFFHVGAWEKYSYTTPPGFGDFKLILTKFFSGRYAGRNRLGYYHTPDPSLATWQIFDWSADRSTINIYADSLNAYNPARQMPAVHTSQILITSPFDTSTQWYFKKLDSYTVPKGTFNGILQWIELDENFPPNTVNTALGLDVPFGVSRIAWYAAQLPGEIAYRSVDPATGNTNFYYALTDAGITKAKAQVPLMLLLD